MFTVWNTALQSPQCFDPCNFLVRGLGPVSLPPTDKLTEFDILGESKTTPGRIMGLAEYLGVSPFVCRRFFAAPGDKYNRLLILEDAVNKIKGVPYLRLSLTRRRICHLREFVADIDGANEMAFEYQEYGPAIVNVLRKRVFAACLLNGSELRRIPIFSGQERFAYRREFPALADAIDDMIENIWLANGDRYIRFAWTSLCIKPVWIDGYRFWRGEVRYNDKAQMDRYEEKVTDCSGILTGSILFE